MADLSIDDSYIGEAAGQPGPPDSLSAQTVKVKLLDQKHPEYKMLRETWYKLSLLYAGGWALQKQGELFLRRRPKELSDVYQARLANLTYENHLGTALDWYASELFEEDPHIQSSEIDAKGDMKPKDLPLDIKAFYDRFLLDCDRGGTSFVDTFRKVFSYVLLYQKAYVLMDLPRDANNFPNRQAQIDANATDPYLMVYSPMDAINWECDAYGNLNWIIFSLQFRNNEPMKINRVVDRWYYYDRQKFQVWAREHAEDEQITPDGAVAIMEDEGEHLLTKVNQVPVNVINVPDGLWLANRAMLAAMSHLNTDNVLDWALFMAALAMPVIMSDAEITPTLSEAGFIKLPKDSKYEWTEPVGTSFKHLADRLGELTENIFRSFYLIHQGRSGRATPASQSGVAKQMDMMPSKDILKMFGDLLRAFMQRVLNLVALAHGDKGIQWDVRGFEFKDDISDAEVQTLADVLALNIPSDTLEKEIFKRIGKAAIPDANPNIIRQIFQEVTDSKDRLTRQLDEMKQTSDARASAMGSDKMLSAADAFSKAVGSGDEPQGDSN